MRMLLRIPGRGSCFDHYRSVFISDGIMWRFQQNENLPYLLFGCDLGQKSNGCTRINTCSFHGGMDACQGVCPQDCNSNHMVDCSMLTSQRSSSCSDSPLHDSGEYQWCLDYAYNRECNYKKHQGILSYHENEVSAYDDISKNIDANLAEIDMETYRSEDIHSILAIPTIFSGKKCGSLNVDSSASPASTSEDDDVSGAEMSICKDEPLFSPLKEHNLPVGTNISTDSLDCGSFEEHDLVLTCRANKNNYTIAFESSSIQFSDSDSDYREAERSSEGETFRNGANGGPSMIRSDLAFTTWSKLRRVRETGKKSVSLPDLLRRSTELERSWERCLPLYQVRNRVQEDEDDGTGRVSLLQLFIRQKQSGSSLSSSSDASSCCKLLESDLEGGNHVNVAFLHQQNKLTDNETNNNNNRCGTGKPLDNNNVEPTESDEDNSLYFEDSLVETRTASFNRAGFATPIVEEEEEPLETDTSSSDATMRDSKDPFGSDSSENRSNSRPNWDNTTQHGNLSRATQTKRETAAQAALYRSVNVSDKEVQGDKSGSFGERWGTFSNSASSASSLSSTRKKTNVTIATTRTCGTQIPVHIRDREVQTQKEMEFKNDDDWSFAFHRDDPEISSDSRRSIYVCYPNYSLPDLSFLRKMTASPENGEHLILKPTRHRLPERQPARRRSYSSEGKTGPRDCTNFGHIRDWDSLTALLPAEYRGLISQMRRNRAERCPCEAVITAAAPPIPERSLSLPDSAEHHSSRRSILRKSSSASHCSTAGHQEDKRLSLQEPFQCLLDNIPESLGDVSTHRDSLHSTMEGCPCSYRRESETSAEAIHRLLESDASVRLANALLSEHQMEDSGYDQHCSCSRNKKTVSFCEDVQLRGQREPHLCLCSGRRSDSSVGISEEIKPGSISCTKSIYLQRIKLAVDHILSWLSSTSQNASCEPPLESLVVSQLCPALYALLEDGLLTSVQGLFGPLSNTPWRIAEMTCQQKAGTNFKELLELLAYVNGEESFKNHIYKFNAFILGLLNLPGLLEQWMVCLLSCSDLVQHNYNPTGFLFLTTLPQFVSLRQDLLHRIHPLTYLAFSLDIRAAASVSPTEFVSACPRHPDDPPPTRKVRPMSCIESGSCGTRTPLKPSNSWECGGGLGLDENLNAKSPATSGDSGCSSPPPPLHLEDGRGDSFQRLRQKWEQIVVGGKPPLPNGMDVSTTSPTKTRRKQKEKETRSKLPSPVRGRPQTPESPVHQAGRSSSPPSSSVAGRSSSRRSFIPVRGNSVKRN